MSAPSMPKPSCAAALPIAVRLPAQWRLTDWPGMSSIPAAAVMRFSEDDVVDRGRVDPGPAHHLGQHRGDQRLGGSIDEHPLERPADSGPGGTDNDGCWHVLDLGFRRKRRYKSSRYCIATSR